MELSAVLRQAPESVSVPAIEDAPDAVYSPELGSVFASFLTPSALFLYASDDPDTDADTDTNTVARQTAFRSATNAALVILDSLLAISGPLPPLDISLAICLSRYLDNGSLWSSPHSAAVSKRCLEEFFLPDTEPSRRLVVSKHILEQFLPFLFKAPHSHINPETGRTLPQPLGGSLLSDGDDFERSPVWKGEDGIGVADVLSFAISILPEEWRYIVPPLITLIDDSDVTYRLLGLKPLNALLEVHSRSIVSPLLKTSGVDQIIRRILLTSTSFLRPTSRHTLVSASFKTLIKLLDILYPISPGTNDDLNNNNKQAKLEHFSAFCEVFDKGLVNLWTFAGDKYVMACVGAEVAGNLVEQLGLGSIRYLKVLIPQLTSHLRYPEPSEITVQLHHKTASSLELVVDICRSRIAPWYALILTSAAQCWANLDKAKRQSNISPDDASQLGYSLQRLVQTLKVDQSSAQVAQEQQVRQVDEELFAQLFELDVR